jgi:hypothetical protein
VQWQVPSQRKEYEEICDYMRGMLCDPTCHAEECSSNTHADSELEGTTAECAPAGFVWRLEWKLQPRRRMSAILRAIALVPSSFLANPSPCYGDP